MRLNGNKQVVGPNNSNTPQLYRIKRIRPCHTSTSAAHILSVHNYDTSCHNHTPYDTCFSSFPMHSSPYVSHLYVFHLLFSLHGSLIQPLWLQSILIGCSMHLTFSKKHPYWMVLMLVYMEMAEGLVKPLVILPATVIPFTSFILIFPQYHCPLCSCWFIHSHNSPYLQFTLQITPMLLITLVLTDSPCLTQFRNTFYLWQNNLVRDSSWPLSHIVYNVLGSGWTLPSIVILGIPLHYYALVCFRPSQRFSRRPSAPTYPPPTLDLTSTFSLPSLASGYEYLTILGKESQLQHSLFIQSTWPTLDSGSLLCKYW